MSGREEEVPTLAAVGTLVIRVKLRHRIATGLGAATIVGILGACAPFDADNGHPDIPPEMEVVILDVEPWGAAATAGLRKGDRVEAWRLSTGPITPIDDSLRLLWVAADQAPRDVIHLHGRRGWRRKIWTLQDAAWGMDWMPSLPSTLQRRYALARETGDASAWQHFSDQVAAEMPNARAWAAWRYGEAQMARHVDEGRRAFERARDATAAPELDALLVAREAQALWDATRYNAAGQTVIHALELLRSVDGETPAQLLPTALASRFLLDQREEEEARAVLDRGERLLARWPRSVVARIALLSGAAALDRRAGHFEQAIEQQHRALALAQRHHPPSRADVYSRLGQTLGDVGRYEEAATVFRALLRGLGKAGPAQDIMRASAHNSLGLLGKTLGDFRRSAHHYRQALALFPAGGFAEAGVRSNLGNLATHRGQFDEAERQLRHALTLRQRLQPDSAIVASSHHNLGVLLRHRGQTEEAAMALEQALQLKRRLAPESMLVASTLSELGLVKLTMNDPHAAPLLQEAAALIAAIHPGSMLYATNRLRQGQAHFQAGRHDDAINAWMEGIDALEALRGWLPDELSKARFTARLAPSYQLLASGYLSTNRAEQALLTVEAVRATMLRNLLHQHAARSVRVTSPELLNERRQLDRHRGRLLRRIERLQAEHDASALRVARQALDTIRLERQQLNERLYLASPRLRTVEAPDRPTVAQIRAHLPSATAGLLYATGTDQTIAFLVHGDDRAAPTAVRAIELPFDREMLQRRVEIFRALLRRGATSPTIEPALVAQARWLYQALIAPFADDLEEVHQLYIAPDTALAGLPFGALVIDDAPLTFLTERFSHAIVPSLSSLVSLESRVPPPDRETDIELLAFGSPQTGPTATMKRREPLGALPGAREEIHTLEDLFAPLARAFLDHEATESAVRTWFPKARYVHFATHAVLDAQLHLSSFMVLTEIGDEAEEDGLLHGWEILQIPSLATELVFLAGCETGLGASLRGEGLIGLAQAFHYAGVPAIVASQWRIGDNWVGQFSKGFYRRLRERQSPADALMNTQRALLATQGRATDLSHPHHWAAFTLFGISRPSQSENAPAPR